MVHQNLKDPEDLGKVKKLIVQADVLTYNFRPGVMEKIGLTYEDVKEINPKLIYATITGYGRKGPWSLKPGQDLLIQSLSGLAHLNGNQDSPPTPMGVAVVDMLCGTHFVQGILAALIKRTKTNKGSWVEVSLLESAIDFQLEIFTTYLNNGLQKSIRSKKNNAHCLLEAPYGVYKCQDGHIAIAMGNLEILLNTLKINDISDSEVSFENRDEIKKTIAEKLNIYKASDLVQKLESLGIWCSKVFNYHQILGSKEFKALKMKQEVILPNGDKLGTTRCPIRVNNEILFSSKPAPRVGEHDASINTEFSL